METLGISPKVYVPAIVNVIVGLALIAFGEQELGGAVILAALGGIGTGYVAAPGRVALEPELIASLNAELLDGEDSLGVTSA